MAPLVTVTIHFLEGSRNEEAGVLEAMREQGTLKPGQLVDAPDVEFIITSCEPYVGQYAQGKTEVIVADQVLPVFQKVHVLPYKDTFKYNFDYMYHENIVPYFKSYQAGMFTVGHDFAHEGVRFRVEGVLPEASYGVAGKNTEIFYEGDAIERDVLEKLQLCPFEEGLPEKYRPTKLSLDEAALVKDFLRPYFAQRSAVITPNEVIEIVGIRFKIIAMVPAKGGGVSKDTEVLCRGVALKENFGAPKAKAKGKATAAAKGKAKAKASAGAASGSAQGATGQEEEKSGCILS